MKVHFIIDIGAYSYTGNNNNIVLKMAIYFENYKFQAPYSQQFILLKQKNYYILTNALA